MIARRGFLGATVAGLTALLAAVLRGPRLARARVNLRPPGALPEPEFLDACVRCLRCADACPNDCIRFHGLSAGLEKAFTPYLHARERGCILCGECTKACPTGALESFEATPEGWLEGVKMGTARVNKAMCFSYNGRTCGACYQACPLAGTAIRIGVFETPLLQGDEACVGCGLCEQACLHLPQAIRVIPTPDRMEGGA